MNKKVYSSNIELKEDEKPGEFRAIFSTFNVIDHDGDVTLPGAFTNGQKVRIASWNHKWEELPVGMGKIYADEEKAWVDGRFFLDTEAGMETYKTVKNLEDLQEWSYGFDILDSENNQFDGQKVRVLKKLKVYEVSPVFIGAGIGTGTVGIKSDKESNNNNETEVEVGNDKTSGKSVDDWKLMFEILTQIGE